MSDPPAATDQDDADLVAARAGDEVAFARLVAPHRSALLAHCYRMLGSVHDAEDAVQDALLGAWRGLAGFEGRSSVRSWLYRIATNASLRVAERRIRRVLAHERGLGNREVDDLGEPLAESVFIEPYPDADLRDRSEDVDPEMRLERLESVELAFVAALQLLPATQRAVLLLREVLYLPATDVAETLDTSVAAVNSALQRARGTIAGRLGLTSQQVSLAALGDDGQRDLVHSLVTAWEHHDIDALVALLAEDVRVTMPPLPAWFGGREMVTRFFAERVFANPWRLVPTTASGQLAVAGYMGDEDHTTTFPLSSLCVLSVRDAQIVAFDCFLSPTAREPFALPAEVAAG